MSVVPVINGLQIRKQVENALDEIVAQSCAKVVQVNVSTLDEIKRGKTLFDSKILDRYEWRYSSSFLATTSAKLEQDVAKLAKAKRWSDEFSEKVQGLAAIEVRDEEIQIKFCTDSSSGVELAIIASCKGDNDTHYVKVLKVDNIFNLAPEVKVQILEDREPVYVTLKSGFSVCGVSFEHEHLKHAGDKVHQRIEKIVVPQKASGGEFDSMRKYLIFKLCQTASRPFLASLEVDDNTKNMLEWNGAA